MTATETITYVITGATILVVGSAAVAFWNDPKRARRTVEYMLNSWRAFKQVKEGKAAKPIHIPNAETMREPMPAVRHPKKIEDEDGG